MGEPECWGKMCFKKLGLSKKDTKNQWPNKLVSISDYSFIEVD